MRFGLGQMRLAPASFWAMSLPELRAALAPPGAGTASRLRALLDHHDTA